MLVYVFGWVLVVNFRESYQHGYLEKPPQRSSLWRYGYDTPPNYTDNELYCGGIDALKLAEGKCGPCGDPYIGVRQHEAGGKFASGIIVERLPFGAKEFDAIVKVSSHHMGYFTFHICAHNDLKTPVTQECLDKTPLRIKEGSPEYDYFRYYPEEPWNRKDGDRYKLKVQLPAKLICSQCVLQWTYITGNSWGTNKDGASCLGCGIQEEFRNCADISIGDTDIPKEKNADPRMKNSVVDTPSKQRHDVDVHANSRDTVTEVPRLHTLIPPSFLKNKFEIEKKLLERFRQRQAMSVRKSHSFTPGKNVNRFSAASFLRPGNDRHRQRITTTANTAFSWVDNKSKNSILKEGFQHRRKNEMNLSKSANFHRDNGNLGSIYSNYLDSSNGETLNKLYPGYPQLLKEKHINTSPSSWPSRLSIKKESTDVSKTSNIMQKNLQNVSSMKSNKVTSTASRVQAPSYVNKDTKEQIIHLVKSTESMPRYLVMKNEHNTINDSEYSFRPPKINIENTHPVKVKEVQTSKAAIERLPTPRKYSIQIGNKPIVSGESGINYSSQSKFVFENYLSKLATASKNQNKRQSNDISTPRFVFEHSPQRRKKPVTSTFSFVSPASVNKPSLVNDSSKSTKQKESTTTSGQFTTSDSSSRTRTETSAILKASVPQERIITSVLNKKGETTTFSKTKVAVTDNFKSSTPSGNAIESTTHSLKLKSSVATGENTKPVKDKNVTFTTDVEQSTKDAVTSTSPTPKIRFKEFPKLNIKSKFTPTFRYKGSRSIKPPKDIPSPKPSRIPRMSRTKSSYLKGFRSFKLKSNVSHHRSQTITSTSGRLPLKGLKEHEATINRTESSSTIQTINGNPDKGILPTSKYVAQKSLSKDRASTKSSVSTETALNLINENKPTTLVLSKASADSLLSTTPVSISIQASATPVREAVSTVTTRVKIMDTETSDKSSATPVREAVSTVATRVKIMDNQTSDKSSASKVASNQTPIVENNLSGLIIANERLTVPLTTPEGDVFVTNLSENKVTASKDIKNNTRRDVYIEPVHQKQEIVDKKVEVRQIVKTRTTLAPTTIRRYMPDHSESPNQKPKPKQSNKSQKSKKSKKRLNLRQMQEFQRRYNRALKVLEILKKKPKALLKHPMFAGHKISKSAIRKLIRKMEAAKKHIKRMLNNNMQLSLDSIIKR